ncbi:MAG: signal peptidase I [Fimbriimonadaceae bacterium]|nr:signal peptidase I [Fimbriimonadaceae bacterium]
MEAAAGVQAMQGSRRKRVLFTGFGVFLLFVLAFAIFFYFNFRTIEVAGPSMEPTLQPGQKVLVTRAYWLVGEIRNGDIVVAETRDPEGAESYVIKRVHAKGGEVVDFLNAPDNWNFLNGEYRVPDGEFYLLGDNKPASEDSRVFGAVDAGRILGKVLVLGLTLSLTN